MSCLSDNVPTKDASIGLYKQRKRFETDKSDNSTGLLASR